MTLTITGQPPAAAPQVQAPQVQAAPAVPAPAVDPIGFAAAAAYSIPPEVAATSRSPQVAPLPGGFQPQAYGEAVRAAMPPGQRFAASTLKGMLDGHPAVARLAQTMAAEPQFFGVG